MEGKVEWFVSFFISPHLYHHHRPTTDGDRRSYFHDNFLDHHPSTYAFQPSTDYGFRYDVTCPILYPQLVAYPLLLPLCRLWRSGRKLAICLFTTSGWIRSDFSPDYRRGTYCFFQSNLYVLYPSLRSTEPGMRRGMDIKMEERKADF
jgi:hypothetical protein